jgi:hypothetical protein
MGFTTEAPALLAACVRFRSSSGGSRGKAPNTIFTRLRFSRRLARASCVRWWVLFW